MRSSIRRVVALPTATTIRQTVRSDSVSRMMEVPSVPVSSRYRASCWQSRSGVTVRMYSALHRWKCRIARVESNRLAELEGVDDELAVVGGVDLGRPEDAVVRQFAHELREDAGGVARAHARPLRAVLVAQRQLERSAGGLGRDDGAEVAELVAVVRVLEVHQGHGLQEPRDDLVGRLLKAGAEITDEFVRSGGRNGMRFRFDWHLCSHSVGDPLHQPPRNARGRALAHFDQAPIVIANGP